MELPSQRGHIPALDGLRGLAVIGVICAHANLTTFVPTKAGILLDALFGCGWIGVDLFFVLSGFLITRILNNVHGSETYLPHFYARRALRIMPLYFFYLVLISILGHPALGMYWVRPLSVSDTASLAAYFYNFRVALVTETPIPMTHHFWSLGVEEHFYLLWPLLVGQLSRSGLMRLCVVGAAISLVLRIAVILSGEWLQIAYLVTPCRCDGLLAGSFVALAVSDKTTSLRLRERAGRIVLGSGCLLLGLLLGQRHFIDFIDFRRITGPAVDSSMTLTIGIAALSLFFSGSLVQVLFAPTGHFVRRVLEMSWLRAIGNYSYAMYVFHELIRGTILGLLKNHASRAFQSPDYFAKPTLAVALVCLSYLAAMASYRILERPFLRWKRHFAFDQEAVPTEALVRGPVKSPLSGRTELNRPLQRGARRPIDSFSQNK